VSSPCSRLHLLIYSDNRGLHRHPLLLCASQPSWRPSLLVFSPTWREVISTRPVLRPPGIGTPVLAFVPDAFPRMASLVVVPRPRVRLCVLGFGTTRVCLCPRHAPGSGKAMAASRPRWLGLHRHSPSLSSTTALTRHHPSTVPYAPVASSTATATSAPDNGDPSHDYLDQGCSTNHSWLPRHRHKGCHLA
jgi:hypothetical protein